VLSPLSSVDIVIAELLSAAGDGNPALLNWNSVYKPRRLRISLSES
jgi:hypothetical protein